MSWVGFTMKTTKLDKDFVFQNWLASNAWKQIQMGFKWFLVLSAFYTCQDASFEIWQHHSGQFSHKAYLWCLFICMCIRRASFLLWECGYMMKCQATSWLAICLHKWALYLIRPVIDLNCHYCQHLTVALPARWYLVIYHTDEPSQITLYSSRDNFSSD